MKAKDRKSIASTSRRASLRSRTTKSLLINPENLIEPLVTVPPDGGWGWVVVTACFLAMFCVDGIGFSFAIFFQDISKDLNCKITEVAFTSSILGGFYFLSGPITCSVINRFGFQIVGVCGGILGGTSFFLASYMTNILPFTIIVGIFGGTAFNLMYTPGTIAVGFYFERWRALAMAITCCGSSLGVMCVPFIMAQVFGNCDWRTKFKIVSACFGICGALGLTYRPLKSTKVDTYVQFGDGSTIPSLIGRFSETETHTKLGGVRAFIERFRNALFPTISEVSAQASTFESRAPSRYGSKVSGFGFAYGTEYYLRRMTTETEALSTYMRIDLSDETIENKSMLMTVQEEDSDDEKVGKCKKCLGKCKIFCSKYCCKEIEFDEDDDISITNVNRPMYRDDIFYTGSVNVLSQYSKMGVSRTSRPAIQKGEPSIRTMSVSRAVTQRDVLEQGRCVCCPEAFLRVIVTMLHFQMFKSPTFILLLISGYLSLMGMYICYTYVVERAIEMGIENKSATMLVSVLGISNTIGRALCGVVSCYPTDINVISWISIGICGAITVVSIYLPTITGQIIFCSIFGLTLAAFSVLRTIMFVEMFGIENLTNCFGLNMIFQSAAAFSGIPIASYIYKSTGSFDTSFAFTGAAIILSAILLVPLRCILTWEQKNKTETVT